MACITAAGLYPNFPRCKVEFVVNNEKRFLREFEITHRLADRAAEPIKRFSGGMKRRLNIACGVLHRPEVVLLDEPTVGVDPQSRERIWSMLEELRRGGASLLLTTHQLDEATERAVGAIYSEAAEYIRTGGGRRQ